MQFAPERKGSGLIINVTSLIDVMFLLLIFFLVTSSFKQQPAIDLELPNSSTAAAVEEGPLTLYLSEDGRIFLDAEPKDEAELVPALRQRLAETGEDRIMLRADAGSDHGDVVHLIDLIKRSGYARISLGARAAAAAGEGSE